MTRGELLAYEAACVAERKRVLQQVAEVLAAGDVICADEPIGGWEFTDWVVWLKGIINENQKEG